MPESRDNFLAAVSTLLARRVGYRCSNLGCRQPTSGPQEAPLGAVNIGVAAHITAAASGGPRYDPDLTSDERSSPENGIWLCQNCAKLADSDVIRYTTKRLRAWKDEAEEVARIELETRTVEDSDRLVRAERLAPELMAEMRQDLLSSPLVREFILVKRGWVTGATGFRYFYEEHPHLDDLMNILENLDLIRDVSRGELKRYRVSEELVDYLAR